MPESRHWFPLLLVLPPSGREWPHVDPELFLTPNEARRLAREIKATEIEEPRK